MFVRKVNGKWVIVNDEGQTIVAENVEVEDNGDGTATVKLVSFQTTVKFYPEPEEKPKKVK